MNKNFKMKAYYNRLVSPIFDYWTNDYSPFWLSDIKFDGKTLYLLKQIKECDGDVEKLFPIAVEYYKEMYNFNDGLRKMDRNNWENMNKVCSTHILIASSEQAILEYRYHYPDHVIAYNIYEDEFESLPLDDFIFLIETWIKENELYNKDKENYIPPQEREGFVEYELKIKSGNTIEELLGDKKHEIKQLIPKPLETLNKKTILNRIKSIFKIK